MAVSMRGRKQLGLRARRVCGLTNHASILQLDGATQWARCRRVRLGGGRRMVCWCALSYKSRTHRQQSADRRQHTASRGGTTSTTISIHIARWLAFIQFAMDRRTRTRTLLLLRLHISHVRFNVYVRATTSDKAAGAPAPFLSRTFAPTTFGAGRTQSRTPELYTLRSEARRPVRVRRRRLPGAGAGRRRAKQPRTR
jgi:hypothetical protein